MADLLRQNDGTFEYLSRDESKLYAAVRDSTDEKDLTIKALLEKIASASRNAHSMSRY